MFLYRNYMLLKEDILKKGFVGKEIMDRLINMFDEFGYRER